MFSPGVVFYMQEQYQLLRPYLDPYLAPPAGDSVPARDLTQAQARDLVIHYFHNHHLQLEKWPEFRGPLDPSYPKVGEKVRLCYKIGGIDWVANNPAARNWEFTKPMDQRLAVLLVRIGLWLKREWNASSILWGGIGVGRDPNDRHGKGFALDIHGVSTSRGEFNVYRDWGTRPVPRNIGGDRRGRWPAGATRTSYRLELDPWDHGPLFNSVATSQFFQQFYNFLTTEAKHGSTEATPRIGQNSRVLHPDHPSGSLRPGHQNHYHVEIDR